MVLLSSGVSSVGTVVENTESTVLEVSSVFGDASKVVVVGVGTHSVIEVEVQLSARVEEERVTVLHDVVVSSIWVGSTISVEFGGERHFSDIPSGEVREKEAGCSSGFFGGGKLLHKSKNLL